MTDAASSSRCDALIVGGRCAGAATAMLLARRGLSVRVVEKRPYGADTLSTHALMRGAVVQLQRWDLLTRLRAAGTPPIRSATFVYGEEAITVDVKTADGIDCLFAPRRTVLDTVLADAALAAGARMDFGAAMVGLIRDDHDGVRGAMVRGRDGSQEAVRANVVIGADGIGSRLAQAVGAATLHEGRHACGLLFAYWSGLDNHGYAWGYHDRIATGLIPTNGGETCVFVAVPAAEFARCCRGSFDEYYRDLITRAPVLGETLRGATMTGRVRAFGGRAGHLRKAFGDGWALVGDAGYFKDPITAHGITDALRDAEGLAEAVACGTEAALSRFEEERNEASLRFLQATDEIAAFDWSMDRLKRLHRACNTAMRDEVEMLRHRRRSQEQSNHHAPV